MDGYSSFGGGMQPAALHYGPGTGAGTSPSDSVEFGGSPMKFQAAMVATDRSAFQFDD